MMIRLILLALLAVSAWGQITKEITILPGGRIIVKQAGGAIVLRVDTELSVFVPGTTTRGLIANATGMYLTHNVSGVQTAYFAPDSGSGTGASMQLNTSAGAWKFRVLSGNSDAPDSLNGYKVNGTTRIDSSGNASFANLGVSGTIGTSFIPTADNTSDQGSSSLRWREGRFVTMYGGAGNLIAGDGLLQLKHRTSGIQTVTMYGDNGAGTGAGFDFRKTAGGAKFKLDQADSDAPDSVNGYRVNGSSVIDATAGGTIGISGGGFNTTTGGYFTNSTPRINASGDGTFRNLSFTGTGPYTFSNGVSLSGSSVTGSYAGGSGITITGSTISTTAPTSIFLTSPITGSLSSNLLSLACGTCVTPTTLGSLGNSLIPTSDNAISVGSAARRFSEGRFVTLYSGAANTIIGDGLLQMRHRTSAIQTVTMFGDNGAGTGAGFAFTKAGGGAKFKLDQSDSDAPDSVNGYKINGSFPASSGSCGAGESVKSWNVSFATGTVSFTCGTP
jgi:hypothetical protein